MSLHSIGMARPGPPRQRRRAPASLEDGRVGYPSNHESENSAQRGIVAGRLSLDGTPWGSDDGKTLPWLKGRASVDMEIKRPDGKFDVEGVWPRPPPPAAARTCRHRDKPLRAHATRLASVFRLY